MSLISKPVEQVYNPMPVVEPLYELYTTETALDSSLNEVTILKRTETVC